MAGQGGGRSSGSGQGGKARPGRAAKNKPTQGKLKPQGAKDGCKRTPQNAYDAYKGKESYTAEKATLKRLYKGKPEYYIKWVDIPTSGNTWEPQENLAAKDGEDAIKFYEEGQRLLLEQVCLPFFYRFPVFPLASSCIAHSRAARGPIFPASVLPLRLSYSVMLKSEQ